MMNWLMRRHSALMQQREGYNLFDPYAQSKDPSNTTSANTTKRFFTPYTRASGTSWSNSFHPSSITAFAVQNGKIVMKSADGYGVGYAFPAEAGATYRFTATTTGYAEAYVTYYKVDGTAVTYSSIILNSSFTVPADIVTMVITLCNNYRYGNTEITFSNVRLAKV